MNPIMKQKEGQSVRETHAGAERRFLSPAVDIYETKEAYVLEAEMPGVDKNGLEITLEGNVLTFVGRREESCPQGADLVYRESAEADFRRVFELDPAIDPGRIDAKVEQGVLTLTLPKTEKVKPRKIVLSD